MKLWKKWFVWGFHINKFVVWVFDRKLFLDLIWWFVCVCCFCCCFSLGLSRDMSTQTNNPTRTIDVSLFLSSFKNLFSFCYLFSFFLFVIFLSFLLNSFLFFFFFFFFFFHHQGAKRLLKTTVEAAHDVLSSLTITNEIDRKSRFDRTMFRYQQSMAQLKIVFRELQKIDQENQQLLKTNPSQDPQKVEEYERLVAEVKKKNETIYVLMERTRELVMLVQQVCTCQMT